MLQIFLHHFLIKHDSNFKFVVDVRDFPVYTHGLVRFKVVVIRLTIIIWRRKPPELKVVPTSCLGPKREL